MTRCLNFKLWPVFLGLMLCLVLGGSVWAQSPEASVNVTSCTVNTGWVASTCGGTSVTIGGSGFDSINPGVTVTIGGGPATNIIVVNSTNIVCTTPAHAAGAVDVTVTNPDLSTGTGTGLYTYVAAAAPAVTGVLPTNGSSAGGDAVSITGSGFTGANLTGVTGVQFGAANATTFTVTSDTHITATSPPHALGTVDVTVTTCAGTSATGAADQFTYTACSMPTVTSLSVSGGTSCGGTASVATGTNLTGATAVTVGGIAAASFAPVNSTTVNFVTPALPGAGFYDVTVTTPCGTSALNPPGDQFDPFTAPAPAVTSISPNTGSTAGGTTVTVTGSNFNGAVAPIVTFGGTPATSVTPINNSHLTAVSPAHIAATVDVVVSTCAGPSPTGVNDQFTYLSCSLPVVNNVNPSSGPTTGGTTVVLTGTNFTGATAVTFGAVAATTFGVNSATQITAVSPAQAAAIVHVIVTTPCGPSVTSPADQFTYTGTLPPPTVTNINPAHGPATGGTPVTITGTNFVNGTGLAAYMGASNYACTSVAFVSSTTLTAVTPAHPAGTTTVGVKNPDGQQGFSSTPIYTYDASPAPTVTGVTPNVGPDAGGTSVTISGTNFAGATAVNFGTTAATFVLDSATQITATSPAHAAGQVDVTVTTPNGTSAVTSLDHFTYVPCTLTCDTTVPTGGSTNVPVQFMATATPTGCTGTVTYAWTFGDNGVSTDQNPMHTYTTSGTFSWSMTATIGTTTCQKYGSITIITPPTITMIQKMSDPFRLKITGINFHPSCTVKINGAPVPITTWKSSALVIAKKGSALKAMIPAGVTVQITITNNDDGGVSLTFPFSR